MKTKAAGCTANRRCAALLRRVSVSPRKAGGGTTCLAGPRHVPPEEDPAVASGVVSRNTGRAAHPAAPLVSLPQKPEVMPELRGGLCLERQCTAQDVVWKPCRLLSPGRGSVTALVEMSDETWRITKPGPEPVISSAVECGSSRSVPAQVTPLPLSPRVSSTRVVTRNRAMFLYTFTFSKKITTFFG